MTSLSNAQSCTHGFRVTEFTYNNATHSSTGYSPFELDTGEAPLSPADVFGPHPSPHTEASDGRRFHADWLESLARARDSLLFAQDKMAAPPVHPPTQFAVGDRVLVRADHLVRSQFDAHEIAGERKRQTAEAVFNRIRRATVKECAKRSSW